MPHREGAIDFEGSTPDEKPDQAVTIRGLTSPVEGPATILAALENVRELAPFTTLGPPLGPILVQARFLEGQDVPVLLHQRRPIGR
jgi:hypothetical protein